MSRATAARATVIMVPRERFGAAREALDVLLATTDPPFRLVYVDGGSPRAVRRHAEARARRHGFRLLRSERYLAPNHARVLGLRGVTTPYVVFVDNDVIVTPGWLDALVRCADETGAGLVGPLTLEGPPERGRVHCAGGTCHVELAPDGTRVIEERIHGQGRHADQLETARARAPTELVEYHCVLARRSVLERVGGPDPAMLATREHLDLCLAVAAAGAPIVLEPTSVVAYLPPHALDWHDVPFHAQRWNDAWFGASLDHFRRKWNLALDAGFARRYARLGSRRRRRAVVRRLAHRIAPGGRGARRLETLLAALERRLNRWVGARARRSLPPRARLVVEERPDAPLAHAERRGPLPLPLQRPCAGRGADAPEPADLASG